MPNIGPDTKLQDGKYTIRKQIGKGGQGTILLADQRILADQSIGENNTIKVALKTLSKYSSGEAPTYSMDPERDREQISSEARKLVVLHKFDLNLRCARIRDFFIENDDYIVMDYIPGENLEQKQLTRVEEDTTVSGMAYGREEVIEWGKEICQTLEIVHEAPLVHCDIKPCNLIVHNQSNRLYLVDWGISQYIKKVPGKHGGGVTKGYSPPEQYKGEAVPRSDVYALAATLYHCLTNIHPNQKIQEFEYNLEADHPVTNDVHRFFPELNKLDPDIKSVIENALAWDVDNRSTLEQLHAELESISTAAPPPPKQKGILEEVTSLNARRTPDQVKLTWIAPADVHQIVVCRSNNHPPALREGVVVTLSGTDKGWVDTSPLQQPTYYGIYCQYHESSSGAVYFGDGEHTKV